ncbi:aldose epimerase family protein [Lactiplantibacillus pentosus]|uniref:aldose epimerase family protein n=1 Tax=Lactiplantibacillus pentosus TaxID=1589 RepID=UPI0021A771B4|nr:aldose epimerase family protein [Lactiplantibacillus pentosus]MCT3064954.1 galactose mutarotase [Lactiplantibacillus pentosus]
MQVSVFKYGHQNHHDLCEISMVNDRGVQVKILNYGATLESIVLPMVTGPRNVVLSLGGPEDYAKERNFLGGTVGRVVGRIRRGCWRMGNQEVHLPLNDGPNHIHGGCGTDTKIYDFQTVYHENFVETILTLVDPDVSNGYPGNLKLQVRYRLDNFDSIEYSIRAITDKTTIFNPTNHAYFCLDGPNQRVEHAQLRIDSDFYLPLDSQSLPYMGEKSVVGTVFDFRKSVPIGQALNSNDSEIVAEHGLNHPYILTGCQPAVTLVAADKKVSMNITTKSPAVVVYTANHFNNQGITSNICQYNGVALEAQFPPAEDSDLSSITLLPGEVFQTQTTWAFNFE